MAVSLFLFGCDSQETQATPMNEQDKKNLAFDCIHEQAPELSAETQELYNYAYYHDLHNMWMPKQDIWQAVAVYYRIAAANGDYKANVRLQYLLSTGRLKHDKAVREAVALNNVLKEQLPGTAAYNSYKYIQKGVLKSDEELGQFAYLRKAADLGSPQAQYVMSKNLVNIKDEENREFLYNLSEKFLKCSADQGFKDAIKFYGIGLRIDNKYKEALDTFYAGAKQGDTQSALKLENAFELDIKVMPPDSTDYKISYLAVEQDLERARRYKIIRRYLSRNDHLNPKVPDLDDIAPLPPAKLPEWDGKIAFQRWYEGASPKQPSDDLVKKLAEAKGLDPKTGLVLDKK